MYLAEIICGVAAAFALVDRGTALWDSEREIAKRMLSADVSGFWPLGVGEVEDHVSFGLYTRATGENAQKLEHNNASNLVQSDFDSERKTLVVIHGYENSVESPMVQKIKNAALESLDVNVITVDWNYYTRSLDYGFPLSNALPVGNYVGRFIEFLMQLGLSGKDLHIVGHSLGAHVAGFAGKRLQANGRTAGRITGLDPAFPGFYNWRDAEKRLNATDADYVDCIHTCGGMLGVPEPICQADFFPNRGQNVQPGCSIFDLGICSHGRAFEYFAESLNKNHLFEAETCSEFVLWAPVVCSHEGALMGYPAGAGRYTGLFSLRTNARYPFAKTIKAN